MKNFFVIGFLLLAKIYLINFDNVKAENNFDEFDAFNEDGTINVIVEIPAGTIEQWEIDKVDKIIKKEIRDGKFKTIDYLAYPFNYGFIPKTIKLTNQKQKELDYLDVIVIGPMAKRGSTIKAKPIGSMIFSESDKLSTKIIALSLNETSLSKMNSIKQIKKRYIGLIDIIKIWLQNYKGEISEFKAETSKKRTIEHIKRSNKEFKILKNK